MFAASPTPTPVVDRAARRGGLAGGPILAICCLLFLLFLIASTIVLALIPVYLPARGRTGDGFTRNYFTRLTPNMSLGNDGPLDDNSRSVIAREMSRALGFPADAADVSPITLATPAKRKRRGLVLTRFRRQSGTQQGYATTRFRRRSCGLCRLPFLRFFINVILFIGGQFFPVNILVEFFFTPIAIPPTLPPTTSGGGITTSAAPPSSTTMGPIAPVTRALSG